MLLFTSKTSVQHSRSYETRLSSLSSLGELLDIFHDDDNVDKIAKIFMKIDLKSIRITHRVPVKWNPIDMVSEFAMDFHRYGACDRGRGGTRAQLAAASGGAETCCSCRAGAERTAAGTRAVQAPGIVIRGSAFRRVKAAC